MDLNFEQLLSEHNQAFKDAEVYSNWMPPDGFYDVVSLTKFESGRKDKDGVSAGWWKLTGQIEDVQDEKLNGKKFTVGFYRTTALGLMKGAARVLSDNPHLEDLKEAHEVLEAAVAANEFVRVEVRTTYNTKYKKDFTNCYILEAINTTTGASAEVDVAAPVEEAAATIGDAVDSGIPAEAPAEVPQTT